MRPCVPKTVSLASARSFSCSELGFVFSGGWAQTLPCSGYCGAGWRNIFFSLWCQPLCWTCCRASCPGKRRAEPGSGPATLPCPREHSSLLPSPSPALSGHGVFTQHTRGNQQQPLTAWIYSQKGFNSLQILLLFLACEVPHEKAIISFTALLLHWCCFPHSLDMQP